MGRQNWSASTTDWTQLRGAAVGAAPHSRAEIKRTFIATRLSAFPLRRSYKHTVLSLPLLARTLVSLLLNATQAMCSPIDAFDVE